MSAGDASGVRAAGKTRSAIAINTIAVLAVLYTVHFAASLLMPMAVALLLALLFNPIVSLLARLYVPRIVSALLLLLFIGGPFTALGVQLAEPAQRWAEQVPELTARLNKQLETLTVALSPKEQAGEGSPGQESPGQAQADEEEKQSSGGLFGLFGWFSDEDESPSDGAAPAPADPAQESQETGTTLYNKLLLGSVDMTLSVLAEAPVLLAQVIAVVILVLFLTVSGPGLYATALEILPLAEDRARMARMASGAQRELSRYMFTVTLINIGLGLCTAATLWVLGFQDPLLWGTMVALLNFAPYVGPLLSTVVIAMVGMLQYGLSWDALVPAAAYFIINALEAQFVTPAILGRNMRMNPLLIIVWLMLWGWLWGVAGVLIAVPLMVCVKLVIGQFPRWQPWLRLIESRS